MAETTDERLDQMETKLSGAHFDVSRLRTDVAEIQDLLKLIYPLAVAVNARSEAHSKRIDDLSLTMASLIAGKTAVGGDGAGKW